MRDRIHPAARAARGDPSGAPYGLSPLARPAIGAPGGSAGSRRVYTLGAGGVKADVVCAPDRHRESYVRAATSDATRLTLRARPPKIARHAEVARR
jgi:hypothetical protein